jgi:hypothetical protein
MVYIVQSYDPDYAQVYGVYMSKTAAIVGASLAEITMREPYEVFYMSMDTSDGTANTEPLEDADLTLRLPKEKLLETGPAFKQLRRYEEHVKHMDDTRKEHLLHFMNSKSQKSN